MSDEHTFLLQRVQPAMVGLIDGSLSTLAPIFSIALATHNTRYAFIAGLATALGAGVSMGFSEGLSDTGELTGRGNPVMRGAITGGGTFVGGILHTLPFLIPHYHVALLFAIAVVALVLPLAVLRGHLPPRARNRHLRRSDHRRGERWARKSARRADLGPSYAGMHARGGIFNTALSPRRPTARTDIALHGSTNVSPKRAANVPIGRVRTTRACDDVVTTVTRTASLA